MKFDWFAAVLAGLLFLAPVGWAQTTDTDELVRETTEAEQARQAAGQALDLETLSGAPVTYQDVLRDPDNIELNLRFARTQVAQGNVRGAAATLERILLIDPDLAQVRLFYAVVLFRLGNIDEAEQEFRRVAALDIPGDVRAEVDSYLDRIALERRTTRYTASLSLGMHFDTNRNSTPRSGTRLVADVPFDVGDEEADIGYLGIGTVRFDHDLGVQAGHELFGTLTYFHDEQVQQDAQDLQSFIVEGGGVYRSGFEGIDVTPSVSYTHLRLSRETFFQEYGVGLRLEREFGAGISGFASARLLYQTFSPITENAIARERDGRQIEGMIGGAYAISPAMRISADYQHQDKSAKGAGGAEFFSYYRDQIRLNHTWLLGDGQFVLNSFTYQRDRYEDPDPFISGRTRHDDIFRYRVTYGAPLAFIFGAGTLPDAIEDITVTPSIEYFRAHSNLNDFDFENWKFQALLNKTWRF